MLRTFLLILALGLPVALLAIDARQPAEIKLLSGSTLPGDLLELNATQVKVRSQEKESTLPLADILMIDLHRSPKAIGDSPYLEVRFLDGTLVKCNRFALRDKEAELRLFSGLAVRCPIASIHYILCEAQDETNRAEFKQLVARGSSQDVLRLASRDGTSINTFEGIVGEADAKGETLQFKTDEDTAKVSLARVRGIIFSRRPDEKAPAAVCKVSDVFGDAFLAEKVNLSGGAIELTTPSGVKLSMPMVLVDKLDFSLGKMAYLSDLDPISREFRFGTKDELVRELSEKYGRDATLFASKNGSSRLLSVGQKTYAKGLNVHSHTVLEYDVTGYNTFRCTLGIDDQVTRGGRAGVRIEADGKELFSALVTANDKPRDLELKITGVSRLRIVVDRGDDDDEFGDHVSFADARVMK